MDELPPGLLAALGNNAIPWVVDATMTGYTDQGYAAVTINAVLKQPGAVVAPVTLEVKGYEVAPGKIAAMRVIECHPAGATPRFLLLLDADPSLLFGTYDNRFQIKEDAGQLVVDGGMGRPGVPFSQVQAAVGGSGGDVDINTSIVALRRLGSRAPEIIEILARVRPDPLRPDAYA